MTKKNLLLAIVASLLILQCFNTFFLEKKTSEVNKNNELSLKKELIRTWYQKLGKRF